MYEVNGLPSPQGNWYPVTKVAKSTPYSATFVRQLARQGKIDAIKIGRDWLITEQLVLQYIHTQQRRHRKALAILQTAEKAFLTLAFLAIVLSATPKATAEGLDTSTVQGTTISATLHDLASDWQGFESFLAEQFSALFHVIAPTLAEQSHSALASLGDDLLAVRQGAG
jgi:excisionase family DNA binding protein